MRTPPRSSWIVALAALAFVLALPSAAQATLAFVRNPSHPVVFAANDDGSHAVRIGAGANPKVSPDGNSVIYLAEGPGQSADMMLAPATGGASRRLMSGWRDPSEFAFSPDSKTIAALRGGELGKLELVLIDLASGAQRVVASGFFSGLSFSPDGSELVYARANREGFPLRSDVFRTSTGSNPVPVIFQLTHDHNSLDPLWGPNGEIVIVKQLGAKRRKFGPKNELFLIGTNGGGVKRLTHTKVGSLLLGLFPTAWSDNGRRLLAEFEGQDTSYAVAVAPGSGAQRPIGRTGERGLVGTALSADGRFVLGSTGGFEPGPGHDVVRVPYTGGKPKVLAANAFEPDWNR